jgi:hypothetical protein
MNTLFQLRKVEITADKFEGYKGILERRTEVQRFDGQA